LKRCIQQANRNAINQQFLFVPSQLKSRAPVQVRHSYRKNNFPAMIPAIAFLLNAYLGKGLIEWSVFAIVSAQGLNHEQ